MADLPARPDLDQPTHPFGAVADALDLRRRSPDPRRAMIGGLLAGGAENFVRLAAFGNVKLVIVIDMLARRFSRLPARGGPPGGAAPR